MSKLTKAKIFLKSGQTVEFQTTNLKISNGSVTWDRPANAKPKLLHIEISEIAAVTYE